MLAIRGGHEVVRDAVETVTLHGDDSLLLQTTRDQEALLNTVRDLVVPRSIPAAYRPLDEMDGGTLRRDKMPVALGIVGAVMAGAAVGFSPIFVMALAGVVAMVVTGCVKTDKAYVAVS